MHWVGQVAGDRDGTFQSLGGPAEFCFATSVDDHRQPRSSRALASARPRPREAPVTIATGMWRLMMHLQVRLKSSAAGAAHEAMRSSLISTT